MLNLLSIIQTLRVGIVLLKTKNNVDFTTVESIYCCPLAVDYG